MARNYEAKRAHLQTFARLERNPDYLDAKGNARHATVEIRREGGKLERVSVHSEAYFDHLRQKMEEARLDEGGVHAPPPPAG